mmetsp:Transcript_68970/g.180775  ORF Transcript_68970/g.180775 Transcript_68970/m.180775 type:complete len:173 (+) Transcript_68970:2-520(+)
MRHISLPGGGAARSFAAPREARFQGCRSLSGAALAGGAAPAVVSSVPARRGVPAHYKVTMETPEGVTSFECPPDETLLDAGEQAGLELPFACRTGSCSSCTGRVLSGSVDQPGTLFLSAEQMAAGFCLTCTTYPTSDVTIKTHCEEEFVWKTSSGSTASQTLDGNGKKVGEQ